MSSTNVALVELEHRLARAAAWLLRHVNADGSLGNPSEGFFFYRAPWTFCRVGKPSVAAAVCAWVRANMLTDQGTLAGPYRVFDDAYAYRDATFMVGAHLAHEYDLSLGLLATLKRQQDPVSGGFPTDRLADDAMSDGMDIPYTCGAGFALLAVGDLAGAGAVRGFLQRIYDAQPELPHRFYYSWSRSRQQPVLDFPPAEASRFVVDNGIDAYQNWTVGGIAAAFLCKLALAEQETSHLDLARRYLAFSTAATEAQFKYASACKLAWGAAYLYRATGEPEYRDWCTHMCEWLASRQQADGSWLPQVQETLGDVIDCTLELTMHLDTLLAALDYDLPPG